MFIADSLSRQEIRNFAMLLRKKLGLESVLYFPVVETLERLHLFDPAAHFEVVDAEELEHYDYHAETDIMNKCIKIRSDVYDRACAGCGRDRSTIAHELGHFILILLCGVKLARSFDQRTLKAFNDPEWQAKCFAGELLMPAHLIKGMDAKQIAMKCGVSIEAASFQLSKIS